MIIYAFGRCCGVDQAIIDHNSAIISHKDTLRVLRLRLILETKVSALQWDSSFVKKIQLCNRLVNFYLPLVSNQPTSYYRKLTVSFQSLSTLVIFTKIVSCSEWSPGRALEIFQASTKLKSLHFEDPMLCLFTDAWYRRHLVREELELLYCLSKVGEVTSGDVEEWKIRVDKRV